MSLELLIELEVLLLIADNLQLEFCDVTPLLYAMTYCL